MLELLESRIAPASLVNPKTVEFTDVDGDVVHVLLSQPLFDKAMHGFTFEPSGEGERLVSLALPPSATGVSLSIFVIKQSAEGDGAVNVGVISSLTDLAAVKIEGGLGALRAGDNDLSTPALQMLKVRSLGATGMPESLSLADVKTVLRGNVGAIRVGEDIDGAVVSVKGRDGFGSLGVLSVGGDLIGGSGLESGSVTAVGGFGRIEVAGSLLGGSGEQSARITGQHADSIRIGGDIRGGAGNDSGTLAVGYGSKKLELLGSIYGGSGAFSGQVFSAGFRNPVSANGGFGSLTIRGDIIGGVGQESGQLHIGGFIEKLRVMGSIVGGEGNSSGAIFGVGLKTGTIAGDVRGGSGRESGKIDFNRGSHGGLQRIDDLTIKGTVEGGAGYSSGAVLLQTNGHLRIGGSIIGHAGSSGVLLIKTNTRGIEVGGSIIGEEQNSGIVYIDGNSGPVEIHGSVVGNAAFSGHVFVEKSKSVTVSGSIIGGDESSGVVHGGGRIDRIFVGGDVLGGSGREAGSIIVAGKLGSLSIKGSLVGSTGIDSGRVSASQLREVNISGDVKGGSAAGLMDEGGLHGSGLIFSKKGFDSVNIGGALTGGEGAFSGAVITGGMLEKVEIHGGVNGGAGITSGTIRGAKGIGAITIYGSLIGGVGGESGTIRAGYDPQSGGFFHSSIGSITIYGDVLGGAGYLSGYIEAPKQLGRLSVDGSLIGGSSPYSGLIGASHLNVASIRGDIVGTDQPGTGMLQAYHAGSIVIGGSVVAGSAAGSGGITGATAKSISIEGSVVGGSGFSSGSITYSQRIDELEIVGSLRGGAAPQSGWLQAQHFGTVHIHGNIEETEMHAVNGNDLRIAGGIFGGAAKQIRIGGSIIAAESEAASIPRTAYAIEFINRVDRLSVGGGITGNENNRVGITAGFSSTGMRKGFGVIDVGGSVAFAEISAGFERVGTLLGSSVSNPDARIGSLSVGGNWFASSVSAGVAPGNDGYFGTSDDLFAPTTNKQTRVVSAIAQIVIGGQVRGTSMESDYFGFVAGQIGKMSVGGASIPLREGRIDVVPIATETDDVTVREIKQL
ncbi:beta strand repeat-containing protein [Verrucomicrobiota bacterium sgz303538]